MNAIPLIMSAAHRGETAMAAELLVVADRHRAEHEVYHTATDLARWSETNAARLAQAGGHYGLHLEAAARERGTSVLTVLPAEPDAMPVPVPEAIPPLLRDLRDLYLAASENSVYWVMLDQAAKATKDQRLVALVAECRPQTERQMRWAETLIKTASPQILTSG
jgi:hypothetical protein